MLKRWWLVLMVLVLGISPVMAQDSTGELHIPSPERWEDQIIYFVMIDRFNDGDPSNNDQGADEYDPEDGSKFQGGDLQGIIDQIDYIQGLGATAVWITPPVSNQWYDPIVDFGGYHGYWAEDFSSVDPHFGDLESYQALSRALHANDMYLIQDIVTNHVGNFFTYVGEDGDVNWNPDDPTEGYRENPNSVPVTDPSQSPFDLNDPTNPEHLEAAIYNWTPPITDYQDPDQQLEWALADLDDLNTENPVVRDALKQAYGDWIEQVGVDAFRIDTVLYVEHDFWNDFMHSEDGILAAAERTGRENFFAYGEAFRGSAPYDDAGEREIATYLGTEDTPELTSVINFPLHDSINRVFAAGAPTSQITYRLQTAQEIFPNPALMPTFIDNHDVPRFLSAGSVAGLQQAVMFTMTTPGIPVIYYGTEQAFTDQRAAMFAEGIGSGGQDHFDTSSEMYAYIAAMSDLRQTNSVFTRGDLTVIADTNNGPGVFAYQREYDGQTAYVIYNTSGNPALLNGMPTGQSGGTVLDLAYGRVQSEDIVVPGSGNLTMQLAPREAMVLFASDETAELAAVDDGTVSITSQLTETYTEDITVSGTVSEPGATVQIAVDGVLFEENTVTADDAGDWSATLRIDTFPLGESQSEIRAYAPELGTTSDVQTLITNIEFSGESVVVEDAVDDDTGPYGIYTLPTDATFGDQLDIVQASYAVSGTNLQLEFQMGEVTDVWGPDNGFDHVAFQVFVDVPGQDGTQRINVLNTAIAPENDFAWDVYAFFEGWNINAVDDEGQTINASLEAQGDTETDTVRMLLPSAALGNPEMLDGVKIYVATWDWDGPQASLRALTPSGGQWVFGGADGSEGFPLVMDDVTLGWTPAGDSALALDPDRVAEYNRPMFTVTFNVNIPESTPDDAPLYLVGPFNEWNPSDPAYRFTNNGDGTYTLETEFRDGDALEYRITRGSFANAEVYDPDSRTANRELTVTDDETVNIDISAWWDE